VYIGSTEVSSIPDNGAAGEAFLKTWWKANSTAGKAFTDLKRDRWSQGTGWQFWVTQYNLYGDPKYGSAPPGSMREAAAEQPPILAGPLATIDLTVPDYTVVNLGGWDFVDIPGGTTTIEEGLLRIPYYSVAITYPLGTKVQGVEMTDRSGMQSASGLNLPVVTNYIADRPFTGKLPDRRFSTNEWQPSPGGFDWSVLENPDGSSMLTILIYAFEYNPLTTDVHFYKNYSFNILTASTPVHITSLKTDKAAYQPDEIVQADLLIESIGEAQDVVASVVVRDFATNDLVEGLLLRKLKEFNKAASFSLQWQSSGHAAGYYNVEVTLLDEMGNLIDQKAEMFRLGIAASEITGFSATPDIFSIGDNVHLAMDFHNSGTQAIDGTALIVIQDQQGKLVAEFRQTFNALAPSTTLGFSTDWDTSGVKSGQYGARAYVLYDGTSASTDVVILAAKGQIYLPLILREE